MIGNEKHYLHDFQFSLRHFFPQLPFDHHGPVNELFQSKVYTLCCTGPFNWGEAHCAGEKVKHPVRTKETRSLIQKPNNKQKTTRAQPTTATRNPAATLPVARVPGRQQPKERLQVENHQGTSERTLKSQQKSS